MARTRATLDTQLLEAQAAWKDNPNRENGERLLALIARGGTRSDFVESQMPYSDKPRDKSSSDYVPLLFESERSGMDQRLGLPLRARLEANPDWLRLGLNEQGTEEYMHVPSRTVMVMVPAGEFWMGGLPPEDGKEDPSARRLHIRIHHEFLFAKYTTTQRSWELVMGKNPSKFKPEDNAETRDLWWVNGRPYSGNDAPDPEKASQSEKDAFAARWPHAEIVTCQLHPKDGTPYQFHPVETVSWDDVQEYNARTGLDFASQFEWEYAARAGTTARFIYGDEEKDLESVAVYNREWEDGPGAVGTKRANPLGIHDVIGHMWEWIGDDPHEDSDYKNAPRDGSVWDEEWEQRQKAKA